MRGLALEILGPGACQMGKKEMLTSGKSFANGISSEVVTKPANIFEEYFAAFKQQFTHFRAKGMDAFTAAALRQFYIISQKKDQNYRFFSIVKEELEQDFDEICGIDSVLWLFTAYSLFTEGQGSSGGCQYTNGWHNTCDGIISSDWYKFNGHYPALDIRYIQSNTFSWLYFTNFISIKEE